MLSLVEQSISTQTRPVGKLFGARPRGPILYPMISGSVVIAALLSPLLYSLPTISPPVNWNVKRELADNDGDLTGEWDQEKVPYDPRLRARRIALGLLRGKNLTLQSAGRCRLSAGPITLRISQGNNEEPLRKSRGENEGTDTMIGYQPVGTLDSSADAACVAWDDRCRRSRMSGEMGSGRQLSVIAMIAIVVVGVVALAASPARAHGGADEADAVDLVEQALAIVVNSPGAVGEALERVETALAEEAEEPTGELDIASLEMAAAALETGDLHDAEDALVAALGIDPHADGEEPAEALEESPSDSSPDAAADGSGDPGAAPAEDQAIGTEDSHDEEQPAETAATATGVAAHGLTDRVDGGFRAPSGTDVASLVLAGVLAVGGFSLAYLRRGGTR